MISKSNATERELANFVKGKSQRAEVRDLASQIATDHESFGQKLQDVAKRLNVTMSDKDNDAAIKETKDRFEKLQGADLDKQFVGEIAKQNQKDLTDAKDRRAQIKDQDLGGLVDQWITLQQKHFDAATKLQEAVGQSQPGTSTGPAQPTTPPVAQPTTPSKEQPSKKSGETTKGQKGQAPAPTPAPVSQTQGKQSQQTGKQTPKPAPVQPAPPVQTGKPSPQTPSNPRR